MESKQSNKPLPDRRLPEPSRWQPPLRPVESEKPTVELTDDEIMSFGASGGADVRAGNNAAGQSR